jgi:hypothetical protein
MAELKYDQFQWTTGQAVELPDFFSPQSGHKKLRRREQSGEKA